MILDYVTSTSQHFSKVMGYAQNISSYNGAVMVMPDRLCRREEIEWADKLWSMFSSESAKDMHMVAVSMGYHSVHRLMRSVKTKYDPHSHAHNFDKLVPNMSIHFVTALLPEVVQLTYAGTYSKFVEEGMLPMFSLFSPIIEPNL